MHEFDPINFLRLKYLEKSIILFFLSILIIGLLKSRKKIFISEFVNYTGSKDKKLIETIKGIAPNILIEVGRISKLLKDIDEIHPETESNLIKPSLLNIQDYSKSLDEITSALSTVSVGTFLKIPIGPILNFFSKIMHGPKLSGSTHYDGEKLVINAQLKGGKFDRAWSTSSDEIETPLPASENEKIVKMTEILGYKIIAYLGSTGNSQGSKCSPRWEAKKHYTEGLIRYRESLLEEANKKLSLIKAKTSFGLALRHDCTFHQCYYNLGIVYRALKNDNSAEAAFRKTLSLDSDYHYCYYQLAHIYYKRNDYSHAQWFCEQALRICPQNALYWNLLAVIKYDKYKDDKFLKAGIPYEGIIDIPKDTVKLFKIASALAWQNLCKRIIHGDQKQEIINQIPCLCIRNLAKIYGMKMKRISTFIFNQALFLRPENNDLFFELGKYYFREKKYEDTYHTLERVFEDDYEINDSLSFWSLYFRTITFLLEKSEGAANSEDIKDISQCILHIKECITKKIQGISNQNKSSKLAIGKNLQHVKDALNSILKFIKNFDDPIKNEVEELNLIFSWINIKPSTTCQEAIQEIIKKLKATIESNTPNYKWINIQRSILFSKEALESNVNDAINNFKSIIKNLEENNWNEIQIYRVYYYLAKGYLKNNDYLNALIQACKGIKFDPYENEVRQTLGEIYIQLKDYRKALEELKIIYNIDSNKRIAIMDDIYDVYCNLIKSTYNKSEKQKYIQESITFFSDTLEILYDKSYLTNSLENTEEKYKDNLKKTHLYLKNLYEKSINQDAEANYHNRIVNEMITLKETQ